MLAVSYMGTKRPLADTVAELAVECQTGACLDLFSGMGAVGQALSPERNIWSNDLQSFSTLVAKCQFCCPVGPPSREEVTALIKHDFRRLLAEFALENRHDFEAESQALIDRALSFFSKQFEDRIFVSNRIVTGGGRRHRLFYDRYAGTYFGIKQCAEIDALRQVFDLKLTKPAWDWCVVALGAAIGRCANTTGHFAQPLAPKLANIDRVVEQRSRSIWSEFLAALDRIEVLGAPDWRAGNKVFQSEAISLLQSDVQLGDVGLVYADPPYTADQYSRYYHIYETLVAYDYPAARGRGQYRDGRAVSTFCHKSKIQDQLRNLIGAVSSRRKDLILSYPSNGLMPNSREKIIEMITHYFGSEPDVIHVSHSHSTMGASKGSATQQVTEILFRARCHHG